MAVNGQVLTEGVHLNGTPLGDHLKGQASPGRPIGRPAPTGIDRSEDTILKSDHLQATGFDFDLGRISETPEPSQARLDRLRREIAPKVAEFYPEFAARVWDVRPTPAIEDAAAEA